VAESQKGYANVASPSGLLDSNGKGTPTSFTRHTIINQPVTIFATYSQPTHKTSPRRLPRTKLNKVDEDLQRPIITQEEADRHCACMFKMDEQTSPRMWSKTLMSFICASVINHDITKVMGQY
jgi:hypothetical protein